MHSFHPVSYPSSGILNSDPGRSPPTPITFQSDTRPGFRSIFRGKLEGMNFVAFIQWGVAYLLYLPLRGFQWLVSSFNSNGSASTNHTLFENTLHTLRDAYSGCYRTPYVWRIPTWNSAVTDIHQCFIRARADDEFCERCRSFNVNDFACRLDSTYPDVKPSPRRVGKFYEIKKNKRCPLCRLLSPILDAHLNTHHRVKTSPPENLDSAFVWLEVISMPVLRLALRWDVEDCELPLPNTFEIVQVPRPMNGRVVDVELVKSWLSCCEREHTTCNSMASNIASDNSAGFLFIDVEHCTRFRPRQLPRFLALSYVVGRVSHKVKEDAAKSFELQDLPKTLRDAIIFTRLLGEKYLWIDSLCISQEPAKRKRQISCMDQIYSCAVCVLAAAWGDNADAGIPGSHDRSPRTISVQLQKAECLKTGEPTTYSISALDLDDFYLGVMNLVNKHKWITRAWTVQERLLARKVVAFNGRDVFFYCHESRGYETRTKLEAWSHPVYDFCLDREKVAFTDPEQFKWTKYQQIVSGVADRRITFEEDRLDAISGLLKHLTAQIGTEFEMGMPLSHIDYALMWECRKIHSTKHYPSWTWLGKVPRFFMFKTDQRAETLSVDTKVEVDKLDNKLLRITALAVQTPAKKLWKSSNFEQSDNIASYDSLGPEPWANIHFDGYTWTHKRKTMQLGSQYCLLIVGDVTHVITNVAPKGQHFCFLTLLVVEGTSDGCFRRTGLAEMPREEFEALKPQRREFILK